MRFCDRADGVLLTKLPGFRKMWPYMMPSRMESTIYTSRRVKVHNIMEWLERVNATRENKLTLFHIILAASVRMMALCPDLNRFVAGRRIYQRRTIDISFVVRREMTEQSTETVVKMTFDPYSTIDDIAEKVDASVQKTQKSRTSHDEKMSNVMTLLPRFMIRALMRTGRILDYFGLLPASYIKGDGMYASIFIANLGSINLDAINHPLFEWGTASCFVVIGKVKKDMVMNEQNEIQVDDVMDVVFSLDHRIANGFHFSRSLGILRDLYQNPDALLQKPENLPDPFLLA